MNINQEIYLWVEVWRNSLLRNIFINIIFIEYKILILIEKSSRKIFLKEFVVSDCEKEVIDYENVDLNNLLNIFNKFIK